MSQAKVEASEVKQQTAASTAVVAFITSVANTRCFREVCCVFHGTFHFRQQKVLGVALKLKADGESRNVLVASTLGHASERESF